MDGTAPSTGVTRGNGGAGVDKILHIGTARTLREGKPEQLWNEANSIGSTFGKSSPRAAGGWHVPAVLLAPSSLAET